MVINNCVVKLLLMVNILKMCSSNLLFSQYLGMNHQRHSVRFSMCSKQEYKQLQWTLFEKSFAGKWCSPRTYVYDTDNKLIDIMPTIKNELTFYKNRTCLCTATDLQCGENKEAYYSENNLNKNGMVFMFPGCGGYSSTFLHKGVHKFIPFEVNFFHNNTRSRIVVIYKVFKQNIILDSIQITPFRNLSNPNVTYYMNTIPPILTSVEDVVRKLMNNNWYGERFCYEFDKQSFNKILLKGFNVYPYLSLNKNLVKATFEDGLVMVVPKVIPTERHFCLLFGVLMNNNLYKQLLMNYNIDGNLTKWSYDTYLIP